jgi:Fic/DOC family
MRNIKGPSMTKSRTRDRIGEDDIAAIIAAVERYPGGASRENIVKALPRKLAPRTLQFWLKNLVESGRLTSEGTKRGARYFLPTTAAALEPEATVPETETGTTAIVPVSRTGAAIQRYLSKPVEVRKPVGYNRGFLDNYRPNARPYLSTKERAHLKEIGDRHVAAEAAGTYAKEILSRLLIDLSWNSSRLEGNTYSLLDTKRLIEFGEEAAGRDRLEAQMIINHKEAIEFLVNAADEIGLDGHTITNIHGILANNLLPDAGAAGRLRHIAVGIAGSTFQPLAVPQQIEEYFHQILATAAAIEDPFEQSFFVMVQLPYLQPFDDVNKRVSRLAANIPFIKRNLSPLSFTDVPRKLYNEAILGIYELNDIALLKDVYIWAYERSAEQYAAVRQSLGEPDPFRFKHRSALRQAVADVIRERLNRKAASAFLAKWTEENVAADDREHFREMAEAELLSLHEGNFARYQVRPSEFKSWQEIWAEKPTR